MMIIMSEYLLEIRNQQSEMKKNKENEKSAAKDIVFLFRRAHEL